VSGARVAAHPAVAALTGSPQGHRVRSQEGIEQTKGIRVLADDAIDLVKIAGKCKSQPYP
jgi:hypothetical protein